MRFVREPSGPGQTYDRRPRARTSGGKKRIGALGPQGYELSVGKKRGKVGPVRGITGPARRKRNKPV